MAGAGPLRSGPTLTGMTTGSLWMATLPPPRWRAPSTAPERAFTDLDRHGPGNLEAGRSVDPPWEFIVRLRARTAATMVADRITTAIRRHNMWSRTGRSRYGW